MTKLILNQYSQEYDIYLETGTHMGVGVRLARSAGFGRVITIEKDERFYQQVSDRYFANDNVVCLLGDSAEILPLVLGDCTKRNVLIFLDAHPNQDAPWSVCNTPIMAELDAIRTFLPRKWVLFVDDFELYDKRSQKEIRGKCEELGTVYPFYVKTAMLKVSPK